MSDDEEEKEQVNASLSDDDESDAEGGEEGDGGSGLDAKKIVLFGVVPFFILVGVLGALYFTGTFDKMFGGKAEQHGEEHADSHGDSHGGGHGDGHGEGAAGAVFLEMPSMIVNLNSPDGQQRLLRLRVQLELKSQADMVAVEAVMPRVVDQFQTYLRELRVKDLRGSAGIYRLQIELLARVNAAAYPVEVKDVLFQEILIQ